MRFHGRASRKPRIDARPLSDSNRNVFLQENFHEEKCDGRASYSGVLLHA